MNSMMMMEMSELVALKTNWLNIKKVKVHRNDDPGYSILS